MINIDNKFDIGQIVYLKTDKEQEECLIVSIEITAKELMYKLCCGIRTSVHYDFELSAEKNVLTTVI